ncbi:hypothetical protein KIN20_037146 [Parelaphostrongylus tenuis]|uniref:Uncharacterized protein n=1 Tax=Parelaphostrongylus tenuis TaxID=148309 RepID=A0AAD5RDZ5_PARTN|nr:hypothetical protein KIN20_037146 [Parelaphostrongylus tenuis]
MCKCFELLNRQPEYTRFTSEKPRANWLPFLNAQFLRRCIQHRIVPNFIKRKRLHAICGVPEDSHRILDIEMKVLRACLRSKQDNLYAMLKKCAAKEYYCDQYLEVNLWRRIIGGVKIDLRFH